MTATVVGLTLASIGAALFGVVLRKEISERGGKRNAHDEPALPLVVFDAGPDGPTALVPNPVELPAATPPPGGPIAPLEPGPAAPRKRKRESK